VLVDTDRPEPDPIAGGGSCRHCGGTPHDLYCVLNPNRIDPQAWAPPARELAPCTDPATRDHVVTFERGDIQCPAQTKHLRRMTHADAARTLAMAAIAHRTGRAFLVAPDGTPLDECRHH
jgi:hypothetical protein